MPRSAPAALALLLLLAPAGARADGDLGIERPACPDLRPCCVPGLTPCAHPGLARGLLLAAGAASAGGGGLGWLGGHSLGAGDPYSQALGIGAVAGIGAGIGALFSALTPRAETPVADRPGRPLLRLRLTPGGAAVLGESAPWGLGLSLDPTIALGDVLRVQPHVGFSTSLGAVEQIDPRPQTAGGGAFPAVDRQHAWRLSTAAEVAIRLPYPALGLRKPLGTGRVEIRLRPGVELRHRVHHQGAPSEQAQDHVALHPMLFGLRWHVSPRQRFTAFVGPRIDWSGVSAPGSSSVVLGGAGAGTFYAEAWYQIDVPMTPLGGTGAAVSGRLNVGYVHSMLDGVTLDVGPMRGFLGPVNVSFDLRVRRRGAPVAVQLTGGLWLSSGGGPYLEIGLVAPDVVAGVRGAER